MAPPAIVAELVDRFDSHRDAYRSGHYNEAQVREEFLNPFFEALGWDVYNRKGYAEAYKEVIHEAAIKVGGTTKAPDYCFRAGGGVPSFFVEAKKPSIDIRDAISPAYQLRRYAWSAKLPVSILTDFEELAVYDCRVRPVKTDRAATARVLYHNYHEYPECWDELAGLFSPEAIRRGDLDKFIASKKVKKGTAEVNAAFLREIESWRELLARNIALRNKALPQRELNFAVQRTIDRIVFLRICEDRGIERYGSLRAALNGPNVYRRLGELFQRADERYNSGLFYFTPENGRSDPPDELTLGLAIDDKVLKEIVKALYYPDSPYEFSVFPAEILGQVYEQFLGKVIRLTRGHRAVVEDKPEVKKAGGVYYTPTYIVDYIVQHTVGKLVEGKKPQQAARLRILDPACGSGSFLIGAYQYLLDWHRDWYVADGAEKHARGRKPKLYRGRSGEWRLTSAEKKRILLNNIYGMDIDPQAVEVTKLSLLLKVLEGESQETLSNQLRLFHERALPDLADNIKCGNSLIGPDFYENRQMELFDEEEVYRINAFDWQAEFPDIFKRKNPGFDAVIGNPPYIRMEAFKELKTYLRERYDCHDERTDLYVYFIEREHELLRTGGQFGMIVSNKFLRANYGENIRRYVVDNASVERIVDLAGLRVFAKPTVRTIVLITEKGTRTSTAVYSPPPKQDKFFHVQAGSKTLAEVSSPLKYDVDARRLNADGWRLLREECALLLERLASKGMPLKERVDGKVCMGIKSGLTQAFVISRDQRDDIVVRNPEAAEILRPFVQGRHIRRYSLSPPGEFLIYTHHGIGMARYPAVLQHLRPFKRRLETRATKQKWYELQQPQYAYVEFLRKPKIVFPDIATSCRFSLDTQGHFGANTVYFLPIDDLRLLGLLNSRVGYFYFAQNCAALEGPGDAYLRFFGQYMEGFPIPCLDEQAEKMAQRLCKQVEGMLSLHKELESARTGHEKTVVRRQIATTDREIDRMVYELYGLTEEEITIVEDATGS